MNASDWASELLREHAAVLDRRDIAQAEILIADGDGWLAAYDLFTSGHEDGWLTVDNYRAAEALARAKAFSKFSETAEKVATDRLRTLTADHAST